MALRPESCDLIYFYRAFFVIIGTFARNLAAFTLVALIQFVVPLIGFGILRIANLYGLFVVVVGFYIFFSSLSQSYALSSIRALAFALSHSRQCLNQLIPSCVAGY